MWKTWCKYKPALDPEPKDYRVIFDLSEDSNNPKHLDICRQHVVFQHFPMQRLVENPGTWSVNSYKYGQLIAQDSNNIDWIYVIKSGEARVFKYLCPDNIDVQARRRRTQALLNSQSPFYKKKCILNFVNDREYIKSAYRPSAYRPAVDSSRVNARSAPPSSDRLQRSAHSPRGCMSLPVTRQGPRESFDWKSSSLLPRQGVRSSGGMSFPRLVLGLEKGETLNENQGHHDAPHRHHNHHQVVIQETVQELPESASRSDQTTPSYRYADDSNQQGRDAHGDKEDHSSKQDSKSLPSLEVTGAGRENDGEENQVRGESEGVRKKTEDAGQHGDSHRQDHQDRHQLGSKMPADNEGGGGGHGITRQMSVEMRGGLVEPVPIPRELPTSRKSILIPADQTRRPSLVLTSAEPQQRCFVGPGTAEAGVGPRRERRGRSASFLKTPQPHNSRSGTPGTKRGGKAPQVIQVGNHTLPAFVQVETLHPGQVFGLRACLDPEERGPTVSLVSGDCEVLQINKKYFMRHCDDAIYSLIRLKNKPFPSEEDLIDRLDINMQWEEYKKKTLHAFLYQRQSTKSSRCLADRPVDR